MVHRYSREENLIIIEIVITLVLSIPLFLYLHFGFNNARRRDLNKAKQYLGYHFPFLKVTNVCSIDSSLLQWLRRTF